MKKKKRIEGGKGVAELSNVIKYTKEFLFYIP
jgi:hypothetical protein